MDDFQFQQGVAHCEGVSLEELAKAYGTPLYVYSAATLQRHCQNFLTAFAQHPTLACYAVKASSNLHLLQLMFRQGLGADVVSVGEMERALKAGLTPDRLVFSGVGKQDDELARGLDLGIYAFNVESAFELERLQSLALARGCKARVSLRVNPHIDAKTNPKIATGLHSTKFGISEELAVSLAQSLRHSTTISLVGISCHIGSQILDLNPLSEAARRMAGLAQSLQSIGMALEFIDMGGGLGIRYDQELPPTLEAYAETLLREVAPTGLRLVVEPGRVLVGNAGILLTRVIGVKETGEKSFVITDAAMNDLVRPTLYDAFHAIEPVREHLLVEERRGDIVGPVCETGDFLGLNRPIGGIGAGDLLLVRGVGAYGASMASQYNSRPRAAEVLVSGREARVIRRRETLADLWRHEELETTS